MNVHDAATAPPKTFKMSKELLTKWTTALRSGKYKQGKEKLYNSEDQSYCCLGVLYEVATTKLPQEYALLTCEECKEIGVKPSGFTFNPNLAHYGSCAAGMNDAGVAFSEIAGLLELHCDVL